MIAQVKALTRSSALTLALVLSTLAGCTNIPTALERREKAAALAAPHGWKQETLRAGKFDLSSYQPERMTADSELTIYIEGDGLAWISQRHPSTDPSPLNPLALRLALAQPAGNAAYLARPCQLLQAGDSPCNSRYWTGDRFAPEVIDASDIAINQLKARFGAKKLNLIGYSGGAAIAALVAARRHDVSRLVSIAGNLDTSGWTHLHHLTPLHGSINPIDHVQDLRSTPQLHFSGAKDQNIPPALTEGFANLFPSANRPYVHVEPDFDHECCWVEAWPRLWEMIVTYAP